MWVMAWSCRVVCVVGFAACGYPRLASLGGDGGDVADAPFDTPDGPPPDARIDPGQPDVVSCDALPKTCGAFKNDNCCASPQVTGGMFYRSYDAVLGDPFTHQDSPASVASFRLDKYEVTVGRFRAFLTAAPGGLGTQLSPPTAGKGANPNTLNTGWQAAWNQKLETDTQTLIGLLKARSSSGHTWTDVIGTNENKPINVVSWYEAMAFCIWDGGYLPTEAEWNYAASGGPEQRAYPWSTPPSDTTLDVHHASYAMADNTCPIDGNPACTLADLLDVGSLPAGDGLYHQSDLAGNVYEWTFDYYVQPYPDMCANCCKDCASTSPGSLGELRVTRGGAFVEQAVTLRASSRGNSDPSDASTSYILGFRCARPL